MDRVRLVYPSGHVSIMPASRVCKGCGSEYAPTSSGGRPSEYCSTTCRSQAAKNWKRTSRLKRKAKTRAVRVESVDPLKVLARDRWTCQLCGIRTPKTKRGTYESDAPELDHIVPLSKGGEHSYRNTQCACRRCNLDKSDAIRGQMLLLG